MSACSSTQSVVEEEQLAAKKALKSHETLLQALMSAITCQICFEPMSRPFTLAPCGHSSCYACLLSWFRAAPQGAELQPLPEYLADALDPQRPTLLLLNSKLLLNKNKTCPQCRGTVREPPLEVWTLKNLVDAMRESGLAKDLETAASEEKSTGGAKSEPWRGVFPSKEDMLLRLNEQTAADNDLGILDEGDDVRRCTVCLHEIWEAFCTGCGRNYPGLEMRNLANRNDFQGNLEVSFSCRFDVFMTEIPQLQRAYIDLAIDAEDDDDENDLLAGEDYESSFIDDEEQHQTINVLSDDSEEAQFSQRITLDVLESDDDDPASASPSRRDRRAALLRRRIVLHSDSEVTDLDSPDISPRRTRASRVRQAVMSDEEDDEVEEVPMTRALFRRRGRHVLSDNDEEMDELDDDDEIGRAHV